MQDGDKQSLEQIQAFLEASQEVRFEGKKRKEVYEWITRTLRQQGYWGADGRHRDAHRAASSTKRIVGGLAYPANKYGRVLYGAV